MRPRSFGADDVHRGGDASLGDFTALTRHDDRVEIERLHIERDIHRGRLSGRDGDGCTLVGVPDHAHADHALAGLHFGQTIATIIVGAHDAVTIVVGKHLRAGQWHAGSPIRYPSRDYAIGAGGALPGAWARSGEVPSTHNSVPRRTPDHRERRVIECSSVETAYHVAHADGVGRWRWAERAGGEHCGDGVHVTGTTTTGAHAGSGIDKPPATRAGSFRHLRQTAVVPVSSSRDRASTFVECIRSAISQYSSGWCARSRMPGP